MFTPKLAHRHAALGLEQDRKDLRFTVSRHLHLNLLMHLAEKILLSQPLTLGGDCPLNKGYMQHSLLALVVIPELRISDVGLVDVRTFEKVDLFV